MSAKLPLISVIIPAYNAARTLPRCLDSVRHQTYQNLEIILVDDGSVDQTALLVDELAKNHQNIKAIHQKNQGLSAARNAGLKIMHGKFVTFVDSDDAIALDMIEKLYQALKKHQVKLAACNFQAIKDGHRPKLQTKSEAEPQIFDQSAALTAMLCDRIPIMACGKLYDRELFQDVRFPVGKLYEDVGTTYKLFLQCDQIVYLPVGDYYYYQSSDSIIHQAFSVQKLDLITLTDEMCNTLSIHCHDNVLQDAIRLRRCHARFSILRQLVLVQPQSDETKRLSHELVEYLRAHKADVLGNQLSSRRDRFAMRSLLLGLPVFTFAWKLYASFSR